ncbi:MAG: hypothetical protein CBARDMAM_0943 [uncultured Caballeronia sp.]|nr:MAG: hypothetical protein CBARDMAM_0943 [uncultured Caballeronia sp.]
MPAPNSATNADADGIPIITFSPSGRSFAWRTRWETKGVSQKTLKLLRKLERKGLCKLQLIVDTPHDACLRAKQQATIAIDECVTGNYHLSGFIAGKTNVGPSGQSCLVATQGHDRRF